MEGTPVSFQNVAGIDPMNLSALSASSANNKALAAAAAAPPKYKKAPDAPKRFKSAFIIFSAEKHKEIKEDLAKQGRSEKTTDIAKLVSENWRSLSQEEKEVWEKKARKDKARYEVEKAMYKGPWKVPANKRTPKDPTAPKRPMSAFLAFSNKRRAGLKREHPDATNADLSKMLSKTWKEAPDELRKKYMDEEAALRATYKVEMAKWRKKVSEEKKVERQEREAIAMQAAEARQNEVASGVPVGSSSQAIANQYAAVTGQTGGGGGGGGGTPTGGGGGGSGGQQDMNAMNPAQMYGHPYANMAGAMGGGGFGGMPADPSQYANLMGAGGFGGQAGFMGPAAQQQLLNQLFGQQFKQPMGNLGMYQNFPGQGMPQQQGQQGMQDQQQGMQQQQPPPHGQQGPQGMQQQGQQGMQQMGMPQGFAGGYGMDMQRAMMAAQQGGQMPMGGMMGMMGGGGGGAVGDPQQQEQQQQQQQPENHHQQQEGGDNSGMMQQQQEPQQQQEAPQQQQQEDSKGDEQEQQQQQEGF